MLEILSILTLVSFISLFDILISWHDHRVQVVCHCNHFEYANFQTFLKYFDKYKDEIYYDDYWGAFFGSKNYLSYKIHADIIKFKGKGMVLYPISWLKFCLWLRQVRKINGVNKSREKGIWK